MKRVSWRVKLMGLFTIVLGASLLFQVFYVLPTVRDQQVEMIKARQEEITNNIAWELDRDLMEMENILTRIAERIEFRTMDIAKQQETVPQLAEFSTDIFSLYILDSEGWFVAGTAEDLSIYQTKSYTDKPYFIASVEQGQVHFAAPRSYLNNTLVTASVSVPIESDAGERVGLVLGTIHLNPLIEKVGNYSQGEEDVFLVDKEGTVIAHSGIDLFTLEDGPLSLDLSGNHHVQSIMSGEIGVGGEYEYEGTPHYGSYVILETNGWGVVVESHLGVILAKSNLLAGQLLSVNIVLFVIALVVSLIFTQQITTERQQVEEELLESEQWLSTMLMSIGDAVISTDAKGLVTLMNNVAKELTGWDEADVLGKPLEDVFNIINEQTGEPADNPVIKVLREGVVVGLANHTVLIAKDGTKRPISDSGAPIRDEAGNIVGTVMVFRDITERKEMEERLVRQEKLAVLGQLAGSVGHELRNPLGVISNAVYYLQTVNPDADESTQEYLNMISAEVRGASKIISDLLDFSRTKMPERQEIGVFELVAQVLEKIPPPENVDVKTEFSEDLPEVYVDPAQINQILTNLVVNAYQAMNEKGKLIIKGENRNNQVLITINDSGRGISEEHLKLLFEPLFTTKAKGIGLGLAVSKTLVETNGGTIEVESEVGKGSTFTLILPRKV